MTDQTAADPTATDPVMEGLTEICREALEQPDLILTENTTAADVDGWDSLRMVLIIVAVQERFGVRLTTREIDSLATVGDFATLIRSRTNGAG
jgi:acyl carrier protein